MYWDGIREYIHSRLFSQLQWLCGNRMRRGHDRGICQQRNRGDTPCTAWTDNFNKRRRWAVAGGETAIFQVAPSRPAIAVKIVIRQKEREF
jgi:hypothetical protein